MRIIPAKPALAAVVVLGFAVLLYLIEAIDQFTFHGDLDSGGIIPREVSGLDGIVWAPLLHHGWGHLIANTLPFVIFGFLAFSGGLGQWLAVTLSIWVVSGVGVWITAEDNTLTVGASGLIFGYLTFLLVRGLFSRNWKHLLLAVVLFLYYGSTLLGVLPGNPGVSWQGHLFGAIGGVLAAWLVVAADRPAPKAAASQQLT